MAKVWSNFSIISVKELLEVSINTVIGSIDKELKKLAKLVNLIFMNLETEADFFKTQRWIDLVSSEIVAVLTDDIYFWRS